MVNEFEATERGAGGFGHTGRKLISRDKVKQQSLSMKEALLFYAEWSFLSS